MRAWRKHLSTCLQHGAVCSRPLPPLILHGAEVTPALPSRLSASSIAAPAAAVVAARAHSLDQQQEQAAAATHSIRLRIKDPERTESVAALGLKVQHWVYPITVDSDVPGLVAEGMEIKRRFSDFDVSRRQVTLETDTTRHLLG